MTERSIADICDELASTARAHGLGNLSQLLRMAAIEAMKTGIRHEDGRIDDIMVGVWDWDVVNDLVFADRSFAEMFGVSAEKAASGAPIEQWAHAVHRHDIGRLWEAIQSALSGHLFSIEYRIVVNGHTRWIYGRGLCTMDARGKAIRFLGGMIDITHQRANNRTGIAPS